MIGRIADWISEACGVELIDLKKEFDTVSHNILLAYHGIQELV